jgi:putative ABC transport system permease protein
LFPLRFRNTFSLLAAFGGLALVLAVIGLYGVISYAVSQRTQEMGIRSALGAGPGDIVRMVLWWGMRLVAVGIISGRCCRSAFSGSSPACFSA